jgi:hypothetical protein
MIPVDALLRFSDSESQRFGALGRRIEFSGSSTRQATGWLSPKLWSCRNLDTKDNVLTLQRFAFQLSNKRCENRVDTLPAIQVKTVFHTSNQGNQRAGREIRVDAPPALQRDYPTQTPSQ